MLIIMIKSLVTYLIMTQQNDAFSNLIKTKNVTATSYEFGHIQIPIGTTNFYVIHIPTNGLSYTIFPYYVINDYIQGRLYSISNTYPALSPNTTCNFTIWYIKY